MTTFLITGASRGIGYETARVLVAAGHTVWLGCRDRERGLRAAERSGGRFVRLDVTDDAGIKAAASTIDQLDVLVNNAGILEPVVAIGEAAAEHIHTVFDTNVYGALRVTNAFLPLLSRSDSPAVVNVTSSIGSLAKSADPHDEFTAYPQDLYRASKAALNMLTVQYAKAYPTVRINCVDPGLTGTEMMNGFGQPPAAAAAVVARVATLGPDGPTGQFLGANGTVPW
ncbi:short-chain dehydrogenase [Virgisporangium aliadipatigenens]|uniref:Short-chain dehydrogenase n=1 Tax=Virgisporangium aliadipatigenens TaxID=741659 RepID=A0A8J3YSM2_9ACTN|nr:SDR family NAD(P)-dependent oxidoreductase [Virgisporangium aliadipatigenens]GIJ49013.1 short-chain dehydrogenase [Virgisporangium aliadipatigenens]